MGGGKGGGGAPPQADYSGMEGAMAQMMMMSQMSAMQQPQMPEQPEMSDMPEIRKTEEIDWTDKQNKLAAKMKADYGAELASRKGRKDTIHTSPLEEEEDNVETTNKTLSGA